LYQAGFAHLEGKESIHVSEWPKPVDGVDADAIAAGDVLVSLLSDVRKFKSEKQLSLKAEFTSATLSVPQTLLELIKEGLDDFKATARIADVHVVSGETSISIEPTVE